MHDTEGKQAQVDALNVMYKAYIERLKRDWLMQNRVNSTNVYEVMRPDEHAEVRRRITAWSAYITPLAEAWWRERGYSIIWPANDSEPMKVRRLETE